MRPLSLDLRLRITGAVDDKETISGVAARYRVSRQTVYDLLRARSLGALKPRRHPGNPTPKKMRPETIEAIRRWLREKNDLTLKQLQLRLQQEYQITVSQKAIWMRLKALKLTWKKRRRTLRSSNGPTSRRSEKSGTNRSKPFPLSG
jgi:transposase